MSGGTTPSRAGVWLLAVRPRTLPAGLVPVGVGAAVASREAPVPAGPVLACAAGALLLQIGCNLANDYYDWKHGADTAARLGPTRVTQAGLIAPAEVRRGFMIAFGLATAVGLYLVNIGGWPIVAIGVASLACAFAYTGGPYPLGYLGLGDVLVFAFFGPVAVVGTAYAVSGAVPPLAWFAAVPVGLLAAAILAVNNLRDIDTDRAAGKHTLAVRFGRTASRVYFVLLLAAAFAIPLGMALATEVRAAWITLAAWPFACAPLAAVLVRQDGPSLNRALARTALLLLVHGGLLALALAHRI